MTVLTDTSALLAVLDADDKEHFRARRTWQKLIVDRVTLVCSNYIIVETTALAQTRLGIEAVRVFHEDVVPLLTVEWIGADLHAAAVTSLLTAGRKRLSLVDCTSFEIMRRRGIKDAFAFDRHFKEQGYRLV